MSMTQQVEVLVKAFAQILQQAQAQVSVTNEWTIAHEPMEKEIDEEIGEDVSRYLIVPSNNVANKKELIGFQTGTFLDELFLNEGNESLGGIPAFDSITVLETYRGALKYRVLELCRYNQQKGITAIYVNQRGSEKHDSYEMAGGIGLPHNFDGTVIIDYCTVYYNEEMKRQLGVKRGEFVRFARVLGCRLSGFIRDYIRVRITKDGFLRKA